MNREIKNKRIHVYLDNLGWSGTKIGRKPKQDPRLISPHFSEFRYTRALRFMPMESEHLTFKMIHRLLSCFVLSGYCSVCTYLHILIGYYLILAQHMYMFELCIETILLLAFIKNYIKIYVNQMSFDVSKIYLFSTRRNK